MRSHTVRDVAFLKQSTLTGSVIDPLTLSPAFWYDPSDGATVTIATGISQLNDKSGNTRHATQGTSGDQPALTTGGINSLNTIHGGATYLTIPLFTLAQPVAIAAVMKYADTDTTNRRIIAHNGTSGPSMGTNTGQWLMFAGTNLASTGNDDSTAHVMVGVFNGSSSSLYIDGVSVGSTAAVGSNGFGTTAHTINNNAAKLLPWAGEIGSLIAWASPTLQQVLDITATFKSQWATP